MFVFPSPWCLVPGTQPQFALWLTGLDDYIIKCIVFNGRGSGTGGEAYHSLCLSLLLGSLLPPGHSLLVGQ